MVPRVRVALAEKDGNGFPGGIKLSYEAIMAWVAVLTLALAGVGLINGVFLHRLSQIETSIDAMENRVNSRIAGAEVRVGTCEDHIFTLGQNRASKTP